VIRGLVLSLFPGIGLLDMAFEEVGFCIVRGPDLLWGGDIRKFHPPAGRFDGVIGGPPCQIFSAMRRINPNAGRKHGNMIPEFERCVRDAQPRWFLMENVPDAPLPQIHGYAVEATLLRDVWVGGETSRLRRFCFGSRDGHRMHIETLALHRPDPRPAVLAGGSGRDTPVAIGGNGKRKRTLSDGRVVRTGPNPGPRSPLAQQLADQGLPREFLEDAPFTVEGKRRAIGNGVPRAMGLAVARAVVSAIEATNG
jgi:DNA (cytosine-5)-methyltransferase 1